MGLFDKFTKKKGSPAAAKQAKTADKAVDAKTKAAETKPVAVKGPLAREGAGSAYRILRRPLFTEKTANLQSLGKYSFEVSVDANKNEVARAVRDLYGVKPVSVRIVNVKGKKVRFGRSIGRERDIKKALVTLKSGETISLAATA
ncbi:MAG: 50S ribosomal protein L23 [Patescibacteria group bacterium]